VGVGIRKNFTRALGMHVRLLSDFEPSTVSPEYYGLGEGEWDVGLFGFALVLEGGLRLGPVADSAPWYFDLLIGLGGRFLFGEGACAGPEECGLETGGSSLTVEPYTTYDFTSSYLALDAGAATGFVLGSEEQYDLGIRFTTLTNAAGNARLALGLLFGWAVY
jgi:hypothetical protein